MADNKLYSAFHAILTWLYYLVMMVFSIGVAAVILGIIIAIVKFLMYTISFTTFIILVVCVVGCLRIWFSGKPLK